MRLINDELNVTMSDSEGSLEIAFSLLRFARNDINVGGNTWQKVK
jgi:hypothetical protein